MAEPAAYRRGQVLELLKKLPNAAAFKFAEAAGVFAPFAFMTDAGDQSGVPEAAHATGRILDRSLPKLWRWLSQDVAPDAALPVLETFAQSALGVEVAAEDRRAAVEAFTEEAGRRALAVIKSQSFEELAESFGETRAAHDAGLIAQLFSLSRDIERLRALAAGGLQNRLDDVLALAHEVADAKPDCKCGFVCAILAFGVPADSAASLLLGLSRRRDEHRLDASELAAALNAAIEAACFYRARELAAAWVDPADAHEIAEVRAREIGALSRALRGHVTDDWRRRMSVRSARAAAGFESVCDAYAQLATDAVRRPQSVLAERSANDVVKAVSFLANTEHLATPLRFEDARQCAAQVVRGMLEPARVDEIDHILKRLSQESLADAEIYIDMLARMSEQLDGRRAARATARRCRLLIGRPSFEEHALEIVEAVVVEDDARPARRGQVSRDMVEALWSWVTQQPGIPPREEAIAKFERLRDGRAQDAEAVVDEYRAAIVEALQAALAAKAGLPSVSSADVEKERVQLASTLALLACHRAVRDLLATWPRRLKNVAEEHIAGARALYDALSPQWPDIGPPLMLVIMSRLDRPWHILRILERIARTDSDILIEATEFVVVGEILIDMAQKDAGSFAAPRGESFYCDRVLASLEKFAGVASGMTEEFRIRRDGTWGRRYYAMKAQAARDLERLCANALETIEIVTPRTSLGPVRWTVDVGETLDHQAVVEAAQYARFLRMTKVLDQRAAFAGARASALQRVGGRLETQVDALLDLAHEGDKRDAALAHLSSLARVVGEFEGEEAGDIIRRRMAAA